MKYCPRCLRTEDQISTCPNGDFPGMVCPALKEEDPATTVTLSCGPCDFTRIVPVKDLLSGTTKTKLPLCRRDECACKVVPQNPVPPRPKTHEQATMPEVKKAQAAKAAAPARK